MSCVTHDCSYPCAQCLERILKNLLAVIHGDGGHYTDWHGIPQSAEDATAKIFEMVLRVELRKEEGKLGGGK